MSEAPAWPFERPGPLVAPPEYAELRAECPISPVTIWSGERAWVATRYEAVREVLGSAEFSSTPHTPGVYPAPSKAFHDYAMTKASFDKLDPPQHDVERRMLQKDFMLRKVQTLRPYLESMLDELLDAMDAASQPVDLVTRLGHELPARITCHMLGVPDSDATYLREQVAVFVSQTSTAEEISAALASLYGYFEAVLDAKMESPGDDLASSLVTNQIRPGHLPRDRAAAMLHVLLMGGFDTTSSMIALGTIVLLENPDQVARLRADPGLWPSAVEELLRYLTIAHLTGARVAKENVEISGCPVAAGEGVFASLTAANMDPTVFANPERLDVGRPANRHVAFGFGVHQCIGQALARLELELVFRRLFERFPNMTPVTPSAEVPLSPSSVISPLEAWVDLHGGAR